MIKFSTKIVKGLGVLLAASLVTACSMGGLSAAQPRSLSVAAAPTLGAAASFAVLGGGSGFTNAGLHTSLIGDAGTTGASTMVTGFHSATFVYSETPLDVGSISGTVYTAAPQGTAAEFTYVTQAAGDALAAFNDLAGQPNGIDPGAGQLGGLTLAPGVYKSAAGPFLITGSDLTLDAQGDANAVWIFQMASTLIVGTPQAPQSVVLINGAQAKNVFWQVGSAATINAAGGGSMVGTILASAGITFSTADNAAITVLNGRALGLFASVTMVNTVINAGDTFYVAPPVVPVDPPVQTVQIVVTGTNAAAVVPVVAGAGFLNIVNNGGLVTATENGSGTIAIVNNGGLLTATNTGNGLVTINSDATGVVTVTNTGNGKVTVNATGPAAVTITHTGDDDYSYP